LRACFEQQQRICVCSSIQQQQQWICVLLCSCIQQQQWILAGKLIQQRLLACEQLFQRLVLITGTPVAYHKR
jgi:hypothetical protein